MQGLVHACACGCGGSGFGAAWLDRGATLGKLLQVRTGSHLQVSLPVPVLLILIINFLVLILLLWRGLFLALCRAKRIDARVC